MIEFKHVKKAYQDNVVIEDLSLTINDGEFICIIGPSGCGKTTTLKMINRLNKINDGEILIDGENINNIEVNKLRQGIGYVIQQIGLFPNMTVAQNISVVPNLLKWGKEKIERRVKELLKLINMPYDEYAHKYPRELSGGQQQRIGVLRALAANPPIILMDEPFGALDPITRDILQDELKSIHKQLKKTIVFVTHDMDEAVKMADRIIFMESGNILQFATPEELLNKPASPIIKEFLGKISYSHNANDLTCADVMRTKVFTVNRKRKTLECINMMNQRDIGSVIVVDDDDKFMGIVTIETIKEKGVPGALIEEILDRDVKTVLINHNAKDAFDEFYDSKLDYLTVLNRNKTVAGIITKTSMAKALASLVWGENNDS
ncbi:betaine/proline/choline family ABC transporter ATP-binding protein [Erysipelotrichaceae bacterium OttesenSCG-928-M19]|nr:betaine/proline/choline family ABC transporter ATP-binding protein [Erysipelotrichaceae bacterium OttesenSCG-928-M19]